jgi:uncharacterized membrane-anchored protein YhcB (DUF1043 family)
MWFVIPIVGLVVAGIVALVSEEEASARRTWDDKYQGAKDEVEGLRRDIENHLCETRNEYDFYVLNEYYYSSFRFADNAYKLLEDSRTSLVSIRRMIDSANGKRREISKRLEGTMNRKERAENIGELRNLTEFRDSLQKDLNIVLAQKQDFAAEVKRLNQQTANLKIAMREHCGSKGRDWFASLQQRISSHRV